jgi:hypothetical protein
MKHGSNTEEELLRIRVLPCFIRGFFSALAGIVHERHENDIRYSSRGHESMPPAFSCIPAFLFDPGRPGQANDVQGERLSANARHTSRSYLSARIRVIRGLSILLYWLRWGLKPRWEKRDCGSKQVGPSDFFSWKNYKM